MKEDYLWDKTGEDSEIQGLENALKAFRYEESAPPALPQKVFTLEKPKREGFFGFRFALAAFAAAFVVMILSIFWLQTANNTIPSADSVAGIETPPTVNKIDESFIGNPEPAPFVKVESASRADKRSVVKVQPPAAPKSRAVKAILRTVQPKEPSETLTAEEKYAYNQLMLALSITGSQLKIVKDRINGIENQNAVVETAK
ncbi:MAG TPA: hypothetical protein VGC97_22740 [Pyrinomonadaceae bacterium]|jgi:hypothetical protein